MNFTSTSQAIGECLKNRASVFFVQIGAHDGTHGDPIQNLIRSNDEWKGIFVEPVPYLLDRLKATYDDSDRFVFIEKAVSNTIDRKTFYYVREDSVESSEQALPPWFDQLGSFDRNHITKHLNGQLEPFIVERTVQTTTISQLLSEYDTVAVDLLLIDAEGHDYQILTEFDFVRFRPVVVVYEHKHLTDRERAAAIQLLSANGYTCVVIGDDTLGVLASETATGKRRFQSLLAAEQFLATPMADASTVSPVQRNETVNRLRSSISRNPDVVPVCWVFVCQAGGLESQACLLAASMRQHLDLTDGAEIVAMIPGPTEITGEVRFETIECLQNLGVRIVHFENRHLMTCNPPEQQDWFTNKMCCLEVATNASTVVVLDSDQICTAPMNCDSQLAVSFTARKVGTHGAQVTVGQWPRIAEICDVVLPPVRFRVHAPPEEGDILVPPLFNSGFVSVRRPHAAALASQWRDCFRRLKQDDTLTRHRYYHEQVALAAAVMKEGLMFNVAEPIEIDRSFLHYIRVGRLAGRQAVIQQIRQLTTANPLLRNVLSRDADWNGLMSN